MPEKTGFKEKVAFVHVLEVANVDSDRTITQEKRGLKKLLVSLETVSFPYKAQSGLQLINLMPQSHKYVLPCPA